MAGKSTYMRQVALITLMAHIGSYVPASKADISVCDKIFTRIGASDDLAGGKSTFMVEMAEVSNIVKNATNNSLVLWDEVGRGTSTYDGLSIAWSVVEHISKSPDLKCKTLFATHYHELTKLEDELPGVKNYSVAVKEIDNSVVFLRKIVEGGADHSYGIEVAKLAGLPEKVIKRAKDILKELENNTDIEEAVVDTEFKTNNEVKSKVQESSAEDYLIDTPMQMDFSMLAKEEIIKELKDIDIINITPMKAFNKLYEIINKAKEI